MSHLSHAQKVRHFATFATFGAPRFSQTTTYGNFVTYFTNPGQLARRKWSGIGEAFKFLHNAWLEGRQRELLISRLQDGSFKMWPDARPQAGGGR